MLLDNVMMPTLLRKYFYLILHYSVTMELNVTAITSENGDYIGNSLEWSDVTKVRFESDRAVQLQGAIDQSNTPSMMIDRDFLITYANKATFDLLKEKREDMDSTPSTQCKWTNNQNSKRKHLFFLELGDFFKQIFPFRYPMWNYELRCSPDIN